MTVERPPSTPWGESSLPTMAGLLGIAEGWQRYGACVGADWQLFMPPGEGERLLRVPDRARDAARICRTCPVLDKCRAAADARREQGVWAGAWRVFTGATYRVSEID